MSKTELEIVGDAFDPFNLVTKNMFSILDKKGFLPSVFENTKTSYPYDHYVVVDEESGKMKEQVFQVPVAGYFKNEIHVSVKHDNLKIEMIPETKADNTNKKYIHCGIKKGRVGFEWYIKGIKPENVKTSIGNGMLTVTVTDCNPNSDYVEIKL